MTVSSSIYDALFRPEPFASLWSDEANLTAMLRVESALAAAEAKLGIIPSTAARLIADCCVLDHLNLSLLLDNAADAGNLAIPLIAQITEAVRKHNAQAAGFVHWGATSQDILDTALVLQLRSHLEVIASLIGRVCHDLAKLATDHCETVMPGRTWMQHAVPVTFGLKAAGWLDAVLRHRERVAELSRRVLVLQFGGAAGTLASLRNRGADVASTLAAELGLQTALIPWHANRDRVAEVAAFHGLLAGTLGKIARDLSLAMQPEIAELSEGDVESRGGSSTMPQKRNPVGCAVLLSASVRVPPLVATVLAASVQENERGLGGWHAEWETLPELCALTGGALQTLAEMLPNLQVNARRMRENLESSRGLVMAESVSMALAEKIGRDKAHAVVKHATHQVVESGSTLLEQLRNEPQVSGYFREDELEALLEPSNYLGSTTAMIDSVIARYRSAFAPEEQ